MSMPNKPNKMGKMSNKLKNHSKISDNLIPDISNNKNSDKLDMNNDQHTNHNLVPTVAIDTGRGLRSMDLYSLLLKERTILFYEEFNLQTCEKLVASIMYLSAISEDDIHLYINSGGGGVYACLSVLEAILNSRCKIHTYLAGGLAASCGAMLFLAGDVRHMSPLSSFMLHQVSSGARGTLADMHTSFEEAKKLQDMMFNMILLRSNNKILSMDDVHSLCNRDRYFGVKEAMSYGFVDKLINNNVKIYDDNKKNLRSWGQELFKSIEAF